MFARLLLCTLLVGALGAPGVAAAQSAGNATNATKQNPSPPQLTPEQQAQRQRTAKIFAIHALQIATMVDRGQAGEVWDRFPNNVKKTISRDRFVQSIQADRTQVGAVVSRRLQSVYESASDGTKLPKGAYWNVQFATKFSKYAQPVRELISFHQDHDNTWRLYGYTMR